MDTAPEALATVAIDSTSTYRRRLGEADAKGRSRLAAAYAAGDTFVADPKADPVTRALLKSRSELSSAVTVKNPALNAGRILVSAVRDELPKLGRDGPDAGRDGPDAGRDGPDADRDGPDAEEVTEYLARAVKSWTDTREHLQDSLVSMAYHQPEAVRSARAHEDTLRIMALAEQLVDDRMDGTDVAAGLRAVLISSLFTHGTSVQPDAVATQPETPDTTRNDLTARVRDLAEAADFLLTLPLGAMRALTRQEEIPVDWDDAEEEKLPLERPERGKLNRPIAAKDLRANNPTSSRAFTRTVSLALTSESLRNAATSTRETIESHVGRLDGSELPDLVAALRHEEREIVGAVAPVRGALIGGTRASAALTAMTMTADQLRLVDGLLNPGGALQIKTALPNVLALLLAPRFGPLGLGELLVVRQRLKAYRALDVAHVENLLRGEQKEREHRRRRLTEETLFSENTVELEEERDTQTSERFELRAEVEEQVKESTKVEAGLKIAAQLGPYVELGVETGFAYENAKSEGRKRASTYSKETTEKASTRYAEKVLERREHKLVEEVEETNRHILDATGADENVAGVYQWLSKVYEAQVYNYGTRQMFEFFLPEPATYYIASIVQAAADDGDLPTPPPAFTISPATLSRSNVMQYAALYKAAAVPAAPEEFVRVAEAQAGGPLAADSSENGQVATALVVQIPDGYEYAGYSSSWRYTYRGDSYAFNVTVSEGFGDPGSVPFYVQGRGIVSWTMWVHVRCRLTASAMDAWRLKAWEALRDGHAQMQREYEERLAAAAVGGGVEITGRNPAANERIVRDEVQRQCITALAGASPTGNNGMGSSPLAVDWEQAYRRGLYARFMHQAFEWENVTYVFYPFFWARLSRWPELFGIEDTDPRFQSFLQAGMARVVVPVRPGFETHVEHFRQTGEVWSGGAAPVIGDPDFLSVAAEIMASTGAPGDEEPVGDPWEIVLPTSLVKVRAVDSLPQWDRAADGSWAEVVSEDG